MYLLFLLHRHYEINTVMVAIFVFDTRATEQRSGIIKTRGKLLRERAWAARSIQKQRWISKQK